MKEFNSQVCTTIEQSRKLLELGLKPETADMCIDLYNEDEPFVVQNKIDYSKQIEFVPAWSLHRLIELMDVYEVILEWKFGIYECAISMLEERIKDGLFNKEYLKQ